LKRPEYLVPQHYPEKKKKTGFSYTNNFLSLLIRQFTQKHPILSRLQLQVQLATTSTPTYVFMAWCL